jgi:galactokinase
MTGGGFGGSVLVLAAAEQASEVRAAVAQRFDRAGWAAPRFGTAVPGAGARRIR